MDDIYWRTQTCLFTGARSHTVPYIKNVPPYVEITYINEVASRFLIAFRGQIIFLGRADIEATNDCTVARQVLYWYHNLLQAKTSARSPGFR